MRIFETGYAGLLQGIDYLAYSRHCFLLGGGGELVADKVERVKLFVAPKMERNTRTILSCGPGKDFVP